MTPQEHVKRFAELYAQFKKNRERVPLKDLQGKYANAYRKLVSDLEAEADWWCSPMDGLPDWDYSKVAEIHRRESRPGGLVDKYKAALIDALDLYAFETFALEYYAVLRLEAGPNGRS